MNYLYDKLNDKKSLKEKCDETHLNRFRRCRAEKYGRRKVGIHLSILGTPSKDSKDCYFILKWIEIPRVPLPNIPISKNAF